MDAFRKGVLAVLASALAFGGLGVAGKLAYDAGASPENLLLVRFAVASLVLAPFAWRPLVATPWRAVLAGAALGGFGFGGTAYLYFLALALLPAGLTSFLLYLTPVFVALFSRIFIGERLGLRGVAALLLALLGLAFLTLGGTSSINLVGAALALGGAVLYGATLTASRRVLRGMAPLPYALAYCIGAGLFVLPFALASGTPLPPVEAMPSVIFIGVVATAAAIGLLFVGIPLVGASRAALISTLEPVLTVFSGVLILGEAFGAGQAFGAALVLVGVALLTVRPAPSPGSP